MRIRVRVARRDESEQVLVKLALASAAAHVVGLVIFSILPRFMTPPPPPRTTIAEIVPASALFPGTPAPAPQAPSGPSPSERARDARAAQKPPPPERPKPQPPKPEPPRPSKPPPEKKPAPPAETPTPDPSLPPLPGAEPAEPSPVEPAAPTIAAPGPAAPSRGPSPRPESDAGGVAFGGGGAGGAGGIPGIGSSAFPYDYYRSSLVAILQSNWRRPVSPQGLGEPLTCSVAFTILKSGIIQDPRISIPSGNDALDRSALRAVYDSNPLPPLPFQYGHGSVSAEVVFKLTND